LDSNVGVGLVMISRTRIIYLKRKEKEKKNVLRKKNGHCCQQTDRTRMPHGRQRKKHEKKKTFCRD
tara:strand:+ start:999 stop:1196 length:198 start_codon:yes stop_codon:yes gene_type:complete